MASNADSTEPPTGVLTSSPRPNVSRSPRDSVDVTLQAAGHDRRVGLGRDQRLDQLVRSNRHEPHTVGVLALELAHADSQAPVLRLKQP